MASKSAVLNDAELKLLGQAWQCLKEDYFKAVDFDKLAKLAGHKNPGSSRNALARITKKLKDASDGTEEMSVGEKAPGAANTSSKRKMTDDLGSDDDPETEDIITGKAIGKAKIKEETGDGAKPSKKPKVKRVKGEENAAHGDRIAAALAADINGDRARSNASTGESGKPSHITTAKTKKGIARPKPKTGAKDYKPMEFIPDEDAEEEDGEVVI